MDTVGVKRFDAEGRVIGEHLFVGLFTSSAYSRSPREIPILRRKVEACIERAGFDPASHDGKALLHILEGFPRDELFQMSPDELFETALGILHLQERQRIALFVRRDPFERFISCLVYLPRDRLTTELRLRIQEILAEAYHGKLSAFYTQVTDDKLARLHIVIDTTPGAIPDVDQAELEARLVEVGRSWTDHLQEALIETHGEEQGLVLLRRYANAFPLSYRERFPAQAAVLDIQHAEAVLAQRQIGINLYRPIESPAHELRLKLYVAGQALTLSDVLPTLEHMGLKVLTEIPFRLRPGTPATASGSMTSGWRRPTAARSGSPRSRTSSTTPMPRSSPARWRMTASTGWSCWPISTGARSVSCAPIAKYLRQAGIAFSQIYMEEALAHNARLARRLVRLFRAALQPRQAGDRRRARPDQRAGDPEGTRRGHQSRRGPHPAALPQSHPIDAADQLLPARTRSYISFKLDSHALEELPLPRPLVEIFVYSPRVEGVHLRGGKVARGGIRWSDRREDFRTEVLGLMKAQMVKNAVIVPVGSKGGFVRQAPAARRAAREALAAEVIECYKTLMRGLLDITDNLVARQGACRRGVVRRDGDDPYLVVAADKGTATFSDIANAVSAEYGFWLGDAFASGGSAGYDHKEMGITARGAWESVKRHFREIGNDIQREAFTVVGVGDMSGDVFGNGMLLSPADPAPRRLQPPAHLHRPRSRSGVALCRAQAAVRPAALRLGRLRPRS